MPFGFLPQSEGRQCWDHVLARDKFHLISNIRQSRDLPGGNLFLRFSLRLIHRKAFAAHLLRIRQSSLAGRLWLALQGMSICGRLKLCQTDCAGNFLSGGIRRAGMGVFVQQRGRIRVKRQFFQAYQRIVYIF